MNIAIETKTYPAGTRGRAMKLADAEGVIIESFKTGDAVGERLVYVAMHRDGEMVIVSGASARATWAAAITAMRNFDI